jgi:hypothetical protein
MGRWGYVEAAVLGVSAFTLAARHLALQRKHRDLGIMIPAVVLAAAGLVELFVAFYVLYAPKR